MDTLTQQRAAAPFLQRCTTPIGRVEVVSDGEAVTRVALEAAGALPHDGLVFDSDTVADEAIAQLLDYFEGSRKRFTVPLAHRGTPFQVAVWQELAALGWGEPTDYGAIARAVGKVGAGRAVGGAVALNPTPLLVGCHRVLSVAGRITGWSHGEGVPTKAWLLSHESIAFAAG
ncbi:methylated-DNA--[protein]-cysteine S-methyltransferase [Herbiconiux sp. CPCC 205716]|uniref:Methylated-DNA--[protein]-cysteine S-methyltransferase n=1 Tax=Herbiconiux gentiana TaxID=2970912 RepID=A0ABT2GFT5_9MICO|nr:methylated-DNA--[protein]-cysteine S-methyltransferase [Herbiconiux gentiana]MCS5715043.1 methylated-DNA--[protein]-cysteine S-methyltransferase [Herbiconiux gentiana]